MVHDCPGLAVCLLHLLAAGYLNWADNSLLRLCRVYVEGRCAGRMMVDEATNFCPRTWCLFWRHGSHCH